LFSPRCRAVAAGRISDFGFRIYVFAYILLCPLCSLASFGVTSGSGYYTVDTGAGLVFKVSQTSGDITSLVYNGTQYQATDKNTHIASGLGSATVMATTYGSSYIKLTISTSASNSVVSSLTHYLMVRNGFNHIYMATYIINRHPSDVRNQPWGPVMFNADTDTASSFPAIQFRGTNSPATIKFNLTSSQLIAYTFRIGFTCAYNGGRPDITMNAWNSANLSPSSQPNSRSFTVGTYRGNNALFSFSIPASAFVLGENTLVINPISGSSDLGPWLSAGWVYDALELDIPNTGPAVPLAVSSLNAAAINGSRIDLSWTPRSTNEINFLIERSSDNLAFNLIAATTAGRTNYSDTGLAPGSRFYYRIRASNSAGASAYSNTASAETTLPRFDRVSQSGAALTLNVSGGPAAGAAYLLMSTNAGAPLVNWLRLATNSFDPNGSFTFTIPINLGGSASYYRLQLP
jgi:hypothetical protein